MMIKNYLNYLVALFLLIFGLAGTVCAEDIYVQGTVGSATLNTPANAGGTNVNVGGSGSAVALKAVVGLALFEFAGLEAGLMSSGQIHINTPDGQLNTKDNIYLLNGTFTIPLATSFALTGRLGLAATHSSTTIPDVNYASKSNRHPLYAGLQLTYRLNTTWDLVVDFDHLGRTAEFEHGDGQYSNSVNAGVRYRF